MQISNQTFENEILELHGKRFNNCTFKNCELIYDGDRSPAFQNNHFIDSVFVFRGSALRTLYFMGNLYRAGEGGQETIDQMVDDLKNGQIHGHEVRTAIPVSFNHDDA